jgi:hypothetical protein
MTNTIVTVNVTQTIAPTPSVLQQTGAIVSQGGTTTAQGTKTLLTQASDLTPILRVPLALSGLTFSTGVVTATTAAPHGYTTGAVFRITIAGELPAGYNGTFLCTITGPSTFTYAMAIDPGPETQTGTYVPQHATELYNAVTTFFAQGAATAVYVLEVGLGQDSDGIAYLTTWIEDNSTPQFFYSYLVPKSWGNGDTSDFTTLLASYENTTAKTYFFVTTDADSYTDFADKKCVVAMIESPDAPNTEFSLASVFYVTLHYNPSTTNKVTPLSFAYVFGVTPYPSPGNGPLFTALKAAGVNWISNGAEGGISNTMVVWGTTMDVRPFNYWYSVDWTQINIDLDLSNAIINGSNDPINPLYFNQNGIDRLQNVAANTLSRGVTFGMILGRVTQVALDGPDFLVALDDDDFAGQTVINAVPFIPYNLENPSDYKIGRYSGFSVVMTPLRGFDQIVFNVNVTDFVAGP